MASLLVAALLSFSSHRQQLRRASDTIAAVALADDLLLQLTGQRTGVPVSAAGALPGTRGWIWRTSPAGVVAPMQLPMQVIRLEIIDPLRSIDDRVLASVEVVRSRS